MRRPMAKKGTSDIRVRLKEQKWDGGVSNASLPRYDAMQDPNCPRAISMIFNEQQRVKANTLSLEVGVKLLDEAIAAVGEVTEVGWGLAPRPQALLT